ncbi:MAG: cation-translocating P-type ATPase C-terminal domain-containing protein, partial [bacterium]|nr:cation-translocating P-type ATPase C-terminal domain-containing protein [bacterium]
MSVLAACVAVYLIARTGHTPDAARTLTFTTLVLAFLVIILVNRSWNRSLITMLRVPNTAFRWVTGGTLALLAAILYLPFAQRMFHFAPLHPKDLALSAGAGLLCVFWFEALKLYRRRDHVGDPAQSSRGE